LEHFALSVIVVPVWGVLLLGVTVQKGVAADVRQFTSTYAGALVPTELLAVSE